MALIFAEWNYVTNLTDANQAVSLAAKEAAGQISKRLGMEAQGFDIKQITDVDIGRKLKFLKDLGTSALPDEKLKRFNKLVSDMGSTFSKAKVGHKLGWGSCQYNPCIHTLNTGASEGKLRCEVQS